MRTTFILLTWTLGLQTLSALAWPQWRGPLGTGAAPSSNPPATWSETENIRWKVPIPGQGHASPIAWGDRVVVLTGKDKGRQGSVVRVMPKEERVVVEGLNMVQRHTRPTQGDPQGGIKNKEAPLHVSNVALIDSNGKPTRVGFKVDGDKKVRVAKTTGEVING